MKIKGFSKLVKDNLKEHKLKDCDVVIDGQNFFYNKYSDSKLPYVYGCESDRYAEYLRNYMSIFDKANIKCYVIFKGGHRDINKKHEHPGGYNYFWGQKDIVLPIFMKEVYKQVLDEMDIEYSISEFEAKDEVIAFAHTKKCCIISNDIEFCFSGEPYVPYDTIEFDPGTNSINCGLFVLDDFLLKYRLNHDKIAIFVTLTDTTIFDETYFEKLLKRMKMLNRNKNILLLQWLAKTSTQGALNAIKNSLEVHQNRFLQELQNVRNRYEKKICRVSASYLLHKDILTTDNDLRWFEKGVTLGHIAIPYINLYYSNIMVGSWAIEGKDSEDSLYFSMEIIKYAYNLLTNFEKNEFQFKDKHQVTHTIGTTNAIVKKPQYVNFSPFENGWEGALKTQRLFEHFLESTMPGFNFDHLKLLPEDARLLVIALIYFSHNKAEDVTDIVHSVLLSYTMLRVTAIQNSSTFMKADIDAARRELAQFFHITPLEAEDIYDEKLLYPLVQFQFCFIHLNYLNKLCGRPYVPTVYHLTYNGTFVYKVLFAAKDNGQGAKFISQKLGCAPSLLSFYESVYKVFEETKLSIDL